VKTSRDDLRSRLADAAADCVCDVSVALDAEAPPEVTPAVDVSSPSTVRFADILETA
jgi:hypothetical protein